METALRLCREENFGYLKTAKICNVPRTTLFHLVKSGSTNQTTPGRKPIFPAELEKLIVDYLLEMERRFFGMTRSNLRRFAYQLAKANKLPNPFNAENESAGE